MADMVLAGQDAHIVGWHAEMTDALSFAHEAFKQIAGDLRAEGKAVTLDAIRERVDVSGHSLGGALAEMIGKFFGLSGYNIDGPGVSQLIGRPEYAAFQDQVRADFPELERDYKLSPGQFASTAFSIVGVAGTHLDGVEFSAQPGVMTEYAAVMGALAAGITSGQAPIVAISVLLAGYSAAGHPSGNITQVVEQALGYSPVPIGPADFGTMSDAPALAFYRDNPNSAAALAGALDWYSQAQGLNVAQGLSPNGIPLDGSPVTKGPFQIVAQLDPETGRIREIYVPVSETGAAIGSPFVKEYVVDTTGDVGQLDAAGNLTFIQSDGGRIGVLTLHPDGKVDFQGITSQQQGSGSLDAEAVKQIFEGRASPAFGLPPIDLTKGTIDALLDALPHGHLLANNGSILNDAGSQYGQPPNVAAQQAAIRNLLSPYGDNIQFARSGDTYTLYNADGELIGTASIDGAELRFEMLDGSEHSVNAWGQIDGGLDAPANQGDVPATSDPAQAEGHDPGPQAVIGAVQGLQALMQAIESGDTKAIALASAAMLSSLDNISGGQILPNGVAGGLNVLAAGMNLLNAIQEGNGLGVAASSLNLGSQAAALYANVLKEQGIVAFQAESASAGTLLDNAATLGQVAGGLALVASIVTLVMAMEDGDGVQIAGAALSSIAAGLAVAGYTSYCPPVAFAAIAVTMIGSAVFEKDLPTLEGEATAVWNPDGSIHVLKTVDAEDGGATPVNILQNLVDALQQSLAQQVDANGNPLYAIIPQRLPTIGYAYDPDGYWGNESATFGYAAPGHLYLKWIDENGQEQSRYYDSAGSRNQEGQASLAQEFMAHALKAVVPAWEAETVLAAMNEHGALTAPATGSIDENRARAAQQLHNQDWQQPDDAAGLPQADADGIHQHFTALTVDLKPELPDSVSIGRIGRNVDLDAYIEQTDWVQANQGILSIDLNGDGVIGQNEILTNDAAAAAAHARNSVQWLDLNHDGKLDASDPAFKALGIWLDANRNGQTDDGEFASFLDRGVASLDFTSVPPVLRAADGSALAITEQHLTADVRGDYYQAAFADTDRDGTLDAFAGMLHAKEGGETVLNAVVTHDYTGEAGHTHGGVASDNASGEMRVDEGSNQVHTASDRRHEQTLAKARYDTILQGMRLKAAAGTLTESDVQAINALLTNNLQQETPAVPAMPAVSNTKQPRTSIQ